MTDAGGGWRWDVALSFAGAQRDYVEQVAAALKERGLRCFYDADEQIELWGKYLAEELPGIYGEQAAAVVVFISAEYVERDWTQLERRAALDRAVRERRDYVLPARFDDTPVPGLLSGVVTVDLLGQSPRQFAGVVAAKLAALGIAGPGTAARPEVPAGDTGVRPPGAVRVGGADPRRLGVHAAISVPGVPDEVPPEYVPRDTDTSEFGVRAAVTAAARRGGFVLLVGGSSVGKTRCALEAVTTLLPDWWLVHPASPDQVARLGAAPAAGTVIWLDELQRYLDGEHGLTGGTVRALVSAAEPVVIIGTLWPDRYAAYSAVPVPGEADPRAREREVLDLAAVIRIGPEFSPAEQDRARVAARRDPRLRIALGAAGYGLTQTLAAAPQLVARWEDARASDPYAWAVLTAALDAARLGALAPLSANLLRAAAPGYCTPRQQAEAPGNWFERALAYATERLHGAASALAPAGSGMGQVAGYTVADYLIQHATRERRRVGVPASTWDALLAHVRDPADAVRLADSANRRLLYRYASALYSYAADAGEENALPKLAYLRGRCGELDEAMRILRGPADSGDKLASVLLTDLLVQHGKLDELRALADGGNEAAAIRLIILLANQEDLAELRARADGGDHAAELQLTSVLIERGDLDELRARADGGNMMAQIQLVGLLGQREDLDELRERANGDEPGSMMAQTQLDELLAGPEELDELRARADTGDAGAVQQLARTLTRRGDVDGAAQLLHAHADGGDQLAARQLVSLLADHGKLDELGARADGGDETAAWRLAELLGKRGDLDKLRARASSGDADSAGHLADLLSERGELDEALQVLLAAADAGRVDRKQLADLLAKQGQPQKAEQLRRFGLNPDGSIACE